MTLDYKKYEYAVIATDTVLLALDDNKLKVLLVKMNKAPFEGMWAVPGGLVRGDESVDDSAQRVLREKTGIKKAYIEQLFTFGKLDRDPFGRVVSIAYLGLIPEINVEIKTSTEHGEIKWFDVTYLPKLAYDHLEVIQTALKRLRSKFEYTNIIFQLLPKEFTMKEMQTAYELIREEKIDKRNFQKKVFALNLVRKLDKKTLGLAHRPATIFVAQDEGVVEAKLM